MTRDYGGVAVLEKAEKDPQVSETVMRALDANANITTRYGGRFVQSINGLKGATRGGRRVDWFFYVNGIESSVGAADVRVHPGDRIWWDFRDWTSAMRVPAVVGSFPEPFRRSDSKTTTLLCRAASSDCTAAGQALGRVGAKVSVRTSDLPSAGPRVVVGTLAALARDRATGLLAEGPAHSGVFVRGAGRGLQLLDERARPRATLAPGQGFVAAVDYDSTPATWVVTGVDAAGVRAAIGMLNVNALRNHYAVAGGGSRVTAVPVP